MPIEGICQLVGVFNNTVIVGESSLGCLSKLGLIFQHYYHVLQNLQICNCGCIFNVMTMNYYLVESKSKVICLNFFSLIACH